MAKVGGELVGGELGVVLEEASVGVTFVDSPSLTPAGLTEDPLNSDLTVCQYILPNDVAGNCSLYRYILAHVSDYFSFEIL